MKAVLLKTEFLKNTFRLRAQRAEESPSETERRSRGALCKARKRR